MMMMTTLTKKIRSLLTVGFDVGAWEGDWLGLPVGLVCIIREEAEVSILQYGRHKRK
jgi:hypothetical protein